MWWPFFLKIVSSILLSLASALLLIGLFTDNWVVLHTPFGIYHENLWTSCIDSSCFSLNRGWVYKVFVTGFLGTAATYSLLLPIVLRLLYICKTSKFLSKRLKQTILMPEKGWKILLRIVGYSGGDVTKKAPQANFILGCFVLATMIAMSVYTGHYTNEVAYEDRGFSFWLAWSSFPISLMAAFAALCHTIFQEIEEENEIVLNVVPGN